MTSAERISRNFIKKRGRESLRHLIYLLRSQTDGSAMAAEFGVSRQRVHQWKNALGTTITFYRVHPEIQRIADEEESDE
jgi:hypothetical protein